MSSAVSPLALAAAPASASYTVGADDHGQTTISVSGQGASVTLPQIRSGLGAAAANLLEDKGAGLWQLNANLRVGQGVSLALSPAAGVSQLRLRSQSGAAQAAGSGAPAIDYRSFVYLRTDNGTINIDGVSIYSWDPKAGAVDTDIANGRSYILAKYDARLNINNAQLSYLGSADGESYGVSWRDIGDSAGARQTRVGGQVLNSTFHHNYYGVYTFQASGMLFRGNKFFRNINYGFDPHDYSHDFIVENNQAFENGSHGFIISRGCYNFTFRRNRSYNNHNPDSVKLAHGFMLDPGSPNSADPQAPSIKNLLEDNQAYGNEGYGLRILGSTDNIVRGNRFEHNHQGITVEQGSARNLLQGNLLNRNRINGIFVRGGADKTTILGNTASGNGTNGIYVKSNGNLLSKNIVTANAAAGIALLPETTSDAAVADLLPAHQPASAAGVDSGLVGVVVAESAIAGNQIGHNSVASNGESGIVLKGAAQTSVEANSVERNGAHGIYLADAASNNRIARNTVSANRGNGIRANGASSLHNTWSENLVFGNLTGGILVTSAANNGIQPPVIERVRGNQIAGSAAPGSLVEIFSDAGQQARYFEGRTTASADGSFTFTAAAGWQAAHVNAVATDTHGNSSALAGGEARVVYLPLVIR